MIIGDDLTVPSEVLDCIFLHCERIFKDKPFGPVFAPNSRLHPLLFVCREWHDIAERRLYTSVNLGNNRTVADRNGAKMRIHGRTKCKQFVETVQSDPRLASLVRELRLVTMKVHPEETQDHIRLFKVCKNLEALQLHGCAIDYEDQLKEALKETNLISFKFSVSTGFGFSLGTPVFSVPELLALMQNWPRFEHLGAYLGEVTGIFYQNRPYQLPKTIMQCPMLRYVSINERIRPAQLSCLAKMAPNLEELFLCAGAECNVVFQRILPGWSFTLRRIHIYTPIMIHLSNDPSRNWRSAGPMISSPMVALRDLSASLPMLPPSALVHTPNLEKLTYRGEYLGGMELARIIEDDKLPRLRELDVAFSQIVGLTKSWASKDMCYTPPNEVAEEVSQELRKACGPRNISILDAMSKKEELGDGEGVENNEPGSPWSVDNDWPDITPEQELEEDALPSEDEESDLE